MQEKFIVPIVQWLECETENLKMKVRFFLGTPLWWMFCFNYDLPLLVGHGLIL